MAINKKLSWCWETCTTRHHLEREEVSATQFISEAAAMAQRFTSCTGAQQAYSYLVPPLPFGRICFVVLVTRKGGDSSWSGPWHLGCTSEVFHVHSYEDQFIQPRWAECVFFLNIYPRFVFCLFICIALICLCVPILLFPWAVESSPLQVLAPT